MLVCFNLFVENSFFMGYNCLRRLYIEKRMKMQAVRAYYDEGKFIPMQPVKIPKGSQAIITILDFAVDEVKPIEDTNNANTTESIVDESRVEWLERLREARELAKDEHLPEWAFQRSKEMNPPINLAD